VIKVLGDAIKFKRFKSNLIFQSKSSALISDPLDHLNWPGRPKRNSVGIVSESQKSKGPSLVLVTRPRSSSRGSSETDLSLNIFPSADSGTGLGE